MGWGARASDFFYKESKSKGILRGAVVEWLEHSARAQKVAVSREIEAWLRHAATGKLSLSTQQ